MSTETTTTITVEEETVIHEETDESEKEPKIVKMVYIGPSIPRSNLRNARILEGTEEEINDFISKYAERYPEIKYLLVAPEHLAEAQKKVQKKGNILHKYYQDMAAKAIVSRKKKG